jgi:thioredoxin 1
MSALNHVTKETFESEVLDASVPVLVDFYADWCGPCRMLTVVLEQFAAEFAGRIKIVKVNVDEEPELAGQFRVQSIPTLAFISGGQVVGQRAGLLPVTALRQALNQLLRTTGAAHRVG